MASVSIPSSAGSVAISCSKTDGAVGPAARPRVGRDGLLRLGFERRGRRTVLTGRQYRLPLQALEPVDLDGDGGLTLMLLNPTGGVLGGDVLDTAAVLGPGSRVCLTTPSATRIYRAVGEPAVQRFTATVGEGAALEYMPDHLIPSPGARLIQTTELTLEEGAAAIVGDAWVAGRVARGECWRFSRLDLGLVIRDRHGLLLKDRAVLTGRTEWDRLGGAEGFPYMATFVAGAPSRGEWAILADELADALSRVAGVNVGITPLIRGGLLARVLASSAPALRACLDALWARCRLNVLGLPPANLRKL